MNISKSILNTTPKKMGRLDKMIILSLLMSVMLLVCDSLVTLWRDLRRPIFVEGIFGVSHITGGTQKIS